MRITPLFTAIIGLASTTLAAVVGPHEHTPLNETFVDGHKLLDLSARNDGNDPVHRKVWGGADRIISWDNHKHIRIYSKLNQLGSLTRNDAKIAYWMKDEGYPGWRGPFEVPDLITHHDFAIDILMNEPDGSKITIYYRWVRDWHMYEHIWEEGKGWYRGDRLT